MLTMADLPHLTSMLTAHLEVVTKRGRVKLEAQNCKKQLSQKGNKWLSTSENQCDPTEGVMMANVSLC